MLKIETGKSNLMLKIETRSTYLSIDQLMPLKHHLE